MTGMTLVTGLAPTRTLAGVTTVAVVLSRAGVTRCAPAGIALPGPIQLPHLAVQLAAEGLQTPPALPLPRRPDVGFHLDATEDGVEHRHRHSLCACRHHAAGDREFTDAPGPLLPATRTRLATQGGDRNQPRIGGHDTLPNSRSCCSCGARRESRKNRRLPARTYDRS